MGDAATEAVRRSLQHVGIGTTYAGDAGRALMVSIPGGGTVAVEVKAAAIPSPAKAVEAIRDRADRSAVLLFVGDQISAAAREALNAAGVGWLDRRGHVRLVVPGLVIDTDVPAVPRHDIATAMTQPPIRGRSGLAAASALLMRPDEPPSVTEVARVAGLNASSVTRAFAALAGARLATRIERGVYRPLFPELFWDLASVWPRDQVAIRWRDGAAVPDDDDLTEPGWVAAGVPAAVAWGAPLAVTADFSLHWYAPTEQAVRESMLRNTDGAGESAFVSADPTGLVTATRFHNPSLRRPIAHPLYCALDLAHDSRDREALDQWTPPEGFTRVW